MRVSTGPPPDTEWLGCCSCLTRNWRWRSATGTGPWELGDAPFLDEDAGEAGDEGQPAGRHDGDKTRIIGEKIWDAIEDAIPGDSDHDGH
jgi:hypothetical protein